MIISKLDYDHPGVRRLVDKLDRYQIGLYGEAHCNLDSIEVLRQSEAVMVGAMLGGRLVGIGAVKLFPDYAEIKRMYVETVCRSTGVAATILHCLEYHARAAGKQLVYLETGRLQSEAIRFYERSGYRVVGPFGNYRPNQVSIYFGKHLV